MCTRGFPAGLWVDEGSPPPVLPPVGPPVAPPVLPPDEDEPGSVGVGVPGAVTSSGVWPVAMTPPGLSGLIPYATQLTATDSAAGRPTELVVPPPGAG